MKHPVISFFSALAILALGRAAAAQEPPTPVQNAHDQEPPTSVQNAHDPEADRVTILPALAPKNIVLADLGLHVVGAGYQRTVASHVAISLTGGLYQPWTVTPNINDIRGGYVRLRPYFFLTDEAPRGLWISPFVQAGLVRGDRNGVARDGSMIAGGLAVGYAVLLARHLHISIGAGGQFHRARIPGGNGANDDPSFEKLGLHIDGTIGYAF